MRYENYKAKIILSQKERIIKKLTVIGQLVQGAAASLVTTLTGNLKNSITYQVDGTRLSVRIGTNVEYALIIELGGVIRPRNARALAVPVSPEAKRTIIPEGQSIRDVFPDLVMVEAKGKPPILIRNKTKWKGQKREKQTVEVMYVLLTSVTIRPQPYLKPALVMNRSKIMRILQK
ncbi:MAG TPA: HK97 gp10 family phage protein [Ignavibacteriales bacterium]|nr:HK97 gp10 family phage protein [Ignavibacteriales bacterium]